MSYVIRRYNIILTKCRRLCWSSDDRRLARSSVMWQYFEMVQRYNTLLMKAITWRFRTLRHWACRSTRIVDSADDGEGRWCLVELMGLAEMIGDENRCDYLTDTSGGESSMLISSRFRKLFKSRYGNILLGGKIRDTMLCHSAANWNPARCVPNGSNAVFDISWKYAPYLERRR